MKTVMSWSQVSIEVGRTGANDALATIWKKLQNIKDKSTSMEVSDGDVLTAKATGGVTVAREENDGEITITTRLMETSQQVRLLFLGANGTTIQNDKLIVKSHLVNEDFSLRLTPKNDGAIGLIARKTRVSFRPGYSEEEGHYVDLTFTILQCSDDELYELFEKTSGPSLSITPSSNSMNVAHGEDGETTFVISGQNLTANVTLTLTKTEGDNTIDFANDSQATTFTPIAGEVNAEIPLKYTHGVSTSGTHSAILSIASSGATTDTATYTVVEAAN